MVKQQVFASPLVSKAIACLIAGSASEKPDPFERNRVETVQLAESKKVWNVWAYDFIRDKIREGRKFRLLTVIDEFTRECMAISVKRHLNSQEQRTLQTIDNPFGLRLLRVSQGQNVTCVSMADTASMAVDMIASSPLSFSIRHTGTPSISPSDADLSDETPST